MSTDTTDESKCESVPTTKVVESSCSFEDTVKPSDEFLQVFKLTYTFSKDQSKFNKRQIKTMEIRMKKLFHKVIHLQDTKFEDIITLAYIYQHVSFAYLKLEQTEKLSAAKDFILRCLHLIKDKELDPKIILLTLKAYSHLSHIYYKQHKLENAIEALDKAINFYLVFMEKQSDYDLIDYEDIIIKPSVELNCYLKMKFLYTFILRTSVDIHTAMGSSINESFILHFHLLLIEDFNYLSISEQYKQWIENAMIICDYLITCNRLAEAKSYINKAIFVQKTVTAKYIDSDGKKPFSETSKLYEQCSATFNLINLYQVKYGVALLRQSVKRLLRLEKDEDYKVNNSTTKNTSKSKKRASQRLLIFAPNEETQYHYEMSYISKYCGAQKYFVNMLDMIYKIGLHVDFVKNENLYIQCVLYTSNIYKYMIFYEKDTFNQFLLQRRQVEILEMAENVLSYENNCELVRLLWLQLTIAYSTLIDMKLEDIEAAPPSYMSQKHDILVDEINALVAKGLSLLRDYIYCR
ncbi:uncharacterized protein LOC116840388 isoform X3 [Odontomachus brunneus]|uniref:uncharacterized protein LOC116840388 isoform X3 n=1 Tax=Odontomachus brunneus TaxID=486640 RepID=UPI0013F22668|nr:uncharacterized protein LOC116840388 isoform X3 [Odontomachus brunneus]